MTTEELQAQSDKILKECFPENYPETRYEVPSRKENGCALTILAEIAILNLRYARDRRCSTTERIAASNVARQAVMDQLHLSRVNND